MIPGYVLNAAELVPPWGWLPPVDLLELLAGACCQTPSDDQNTAIRVHTDEACIAIDKLVAMVPPQRTLELLRTLKWCGMNANVWMPQSYEAHGTVRFNSVSSLLRKIPEVQLQHEQARAKVEEDRNMAITADTQRAAKLLEDARELLTKDPAEAMAKLEQVKSITQGGRMPVMHTLARSLLSQARIAAGDRIGAVTEGLEAVKELRDHGLALEAVKLERALQPAMAAPAAPSGGLAYVKDKNGQLVPLTTDMLEGARPTSVLDNAQLAAALANSPLPEASFAFQALATARISEKTLAHLDKLAEFEARTPGLWHYTRFLNPGSSIGDDLPAWEETAAWLLRTGVAERAQDTVHVDNVKLTAVRTAMRTALELDKARINIKPTERETEKLAESKERETNIMAEIGQKIAGAAMSTGTGVVESFTEGLKVAGAQAVSDKIVKIVHDRLGHNLPIANTPLGQQVERLAFPALIHMIVAALPEGKIPGADIIKRNCMRAVLGVAKDDGSAMINTFLPILGEVAKMGTSEGGLDILTSMMGGTTVEQVADKALAPTSEVSALSAALAKGLENAQEGEEVEVKMSVVKKGKRNGKKEAEKDYGVVPPAPEPMNPTR